MLFSKAEQVLLQALYYQESTPSFSALIKTIQTSEDKLFSSILFKEVLASRKVLPVSLLQKNFKLVRQIYNELYVERAFHDCVQRASRHVPGHFFSSELICIFACDQLHRALVYLIHSCCRRNGDISELQKFFFTEAFSTGKLLNLVLENKNFKPHLYWLSNKSLITWFMKNHKHLPPVDDRLIQLMKLCRGRFFTNVSLSTKYLRKSYVLHLENIDTSFSTLHSYTSFFQLILKVNLKWITPFQLYYWKASRIHASHFYYYTQLFSLLVVLQDIERVNQFVTNLHNYHMCGYFFEKVAQSSSSTKKISCVMELVLPFWQ